MTKVYWPTYQAPMCTLPSNIEQALRHFEQFYLGKHNGRKITLNPGLGTADIKAIFFGPTPSDELTSQQESEQPGTSVVVRRKEEHKILTVNTYQMCMLMRFNQHVKMTFEVSQ